jgi:hypothetical protein
MTSISLKILKALFLTDILLILVTLILFDIKILWNTQIGFISASLVMLASMKSYQRMVDARVEHKVITYDDSKDVIDQLEDPYDLYSEDAVVEEAQDLENADKEDKKPKDGRPLIQILKDTGAALSAYRLGAYVVLILGFLYLNRHELLHIPSYILSISIPMLVMVYVLLKEKEKLTPEDTNVK